MTLMDVWLLLCILYVVMQLLEYTVILYILLTDDKNVLESEKKEKLMMCRRIQGDTAGLGPGLG